MRYVLAAPPEAGLFVASDGRIRTLAAPSRDRTAALLEDLHVMSAIIERAPPSQEVLGTLRCQQVHLTWTVDDGDTEDDEQQQTPSQQPPRREGALAADAGQQPPRPWQLVDAPVAAVHAGGVLAALEALHATGKEVPLDDAGWHLSADKSATSGTLPVELELALPRHVVTLEPSPSEPGTVLQHTRPRTGLSHRLGVLVLRPQRAYDELVSATLRNDKGRDASRKAPLSELLGELAAVAKTFAAPELLSVPPGAALSGIGQLQGLLQARTYPRGISDAVFVRRCWSFPVRISTADDPQRPLLTVRVREAVKLERRGFVFAADGRGATAVVAHAPSFSVEVEAAKRVQVNRKRSLAPLVSRITRLSAWLQRVGRGPVDLVPMPVASAPLGQQTSGWLASRPRGPRPPADAPQPDARTGAAVLLHVVRGPDEAWGVEFTDRIPSRVRRPRDGDPEVEEREVLAPPVVARVRVGGPVWRALVAARVVSAAEAAKTTAPHSDVLAGFEMFKIDGAPTPSVSSAIAALQGVPSALVAIRRRRARKEQGSWGIGGGGAPAGSHQPTDVVDAASPAAAAATTPASSPLPHDDSGSAPEQPPREQQAVEQPADPPTAVSEGGGEEEEEVTDMAADPANAKSPLRSVVAEVTWKKRRPDEKWGMKLLPKTLVVGMCDADTPAARGRTPAGAQLHSIDGVEVKSLEEAATHLKGKMSVKVLVILPFATTITRKAGEPLGLVLPADKAAQPVIQKVVPNTVASTAGLTVGARIVEVNGALTSAVKDVLERVGAAGTAPVHICCVSANPSFENPIQIEPMDESQAAAAAAAELTGSGAAASGDVAGLKFSINVQGRLGQPLGFRVNSETGRIVSCQPDSPLVAALAGAALTLPDKVRELAWPAGGLNDPPDPSVLTRFHITHVDGTEVRYDAHGPRDPHSLAALMKAKGAAFALRLDGTPPPPRADRPALGPSATAIAVTRLLSPFPGVGYLIVEAARGLSRRVRDIVDSRAPRWVELLRERHFIGDAADAAGRADAFLDVGVPATIVERIFPAAVGSEHAFGFAARHVYTLQVRDDATSVPMGGGLGVCVRLAAPLVDARGDVVAPANGTVLVTTRSAVAPLVANVGRSLWAAAHGDVQRRRVLGRQPFDVPSPAELRAHGAELAADAPTVLLGDEGEDGAALAVIVPSVVVGAPLTGLVVAGEHETAPPTLPAGHVHSPFGGRVRYQAAGELTGRMPLLQGSFEVEEQHAHAVPPLLLQGTPLFLNNTVVGIVARDTPPFELPPAAATRVSFPVAPLQGLTRVAFQRLVRV